MDLFVLREPDRRNVKHWLIRDSKRLWPKPNEDTAPKIFPAFGVERAHLPFPPGEPQGIGGMLLR